MNMNMDISIWNNCTQERCTVRYIMLRRIMLSSVVRTGVETGKQERGESVLYVYVHVVAWQMYVVVGSW